MFSTEPQTHNHNIVVVYPGRFQPFHQGHKAVFDYLQERYSDVYICTSNKTDVNTSPFSFDEKQKMMEHAGVDPSRIIQSVQPYRVKEITEKYDQYSTILLIAVSEKDMLTDTRFNFKNNKNGNPSYFQPLPENINQAQTFDKHGYIIVVPTFEFDVSGNTFKSASEIRNYYRSSNLIIRKSIIKQLYKKYNTKVFKLFESKFDVS